jgi:hypothetical protein
MKNMHSQSGLDAFQELTQKEEPRLLEVYQRVQDGCRDLIVLKFSSGALTFAGDPDADTVEVRYQETETLDLRGLDRATALAPWSSLVGRPFGWGWVATNQQGYPDGVLLSFDGLEPSVLLVAAASSLRVYLVKEAAD